MNISDVKKTSNPLVSVVLSTYNDEKYIKATIESVLNQTYNNFEFIIWNDGSLDSTEEIVKSFEDERIRYFYHENTGLGTALSFACNEAKGKYIARIDGDDICLPYRFEKEVTFLESHPEVVLVSSSVFYIDGNGDIVGRSYPWTWNRNIKCRLNIVHPTTMFRRDIYEKTCGYQDLKSAQDRILWSKMAKYGKFSIIGEPLLYYRLIHNSLSHIIDTQSPYAKMLEILRGKICKDEIICPVDIELHNTLYLLSKKRNQNREGEYKKKIEEVLGERLIKIIGERMTTQFMVLLKNIYAYLRY